MHSIILSFFIQQEKTMLKNITDDRKLQTSGDKKQKKKNRLFGRDTNYTI